jgi:regulator of protease activity HflC (stomatin/prohibitin superfamily)
MNNKIKFIIGAVALVIVSIVCLALFEIKTVKGNEMGVKETWNDGVIEKVFPPKTYFLFPGFSQEIISYDMSAQVSKMDNYRVQSQEGQDLTIAVRLQWRRDATKLVNQHKTVRNQIDDKIITPVLMRVVKDEATAKKAIDVFSGDGLVALQASIQRRLSDPKGELAEKGVTVENFVIVHIELDPKYIEEIKGRQIATQRQLRAVEEQKAAEAEALVAKSKAQADLNKAVVEAKRDAEVKVIAATAQNEQVVISAKASQEQAILAATGEKQKLILEADGKKQANIAEAEGLLALGKAKAESQKLQLQAYAVQGADGYIKTQIAESMSRAFSNIKGFLPSDMKISVIASDYEKAVNTVSGDVIIPIKR